jgi:hypothetical protein
METGFIMLMFFLVLIGFFAGVLVGDRSKKSKGTIHVDYSDPTDGPYLFLELSVPVSTVVSEKRVILDVDTTQFYSHE